MTRPGPAPCQPSARPPATPPPVRRRGRRFLAGFQKMIALVDLKQLIGRAGTKTLPLGPCHIGIVELASSHKVEESVRFRALTRVFSARPPSRPEEEFDSVTPRPK